MEDAKKQCSTMGDRFDLALLGEHANSQAGNEKNADALDRTLLGEYYDETRIRHGRPLPPRNLPTAKTFMMSEEVRDLDLLTSTLFVQEGIDNWREKRKVDYARRGFTRSRKSFDEFVAKTKKRGFTFSRLKSAKQTYKSYLSSDAFCIIYNAFLDTGGTENASFLDELKNLRDIEQPWNVQFFGPYGSGKSQVARANNHAYLHEVGYNPRYVMDCYDLSRAFMEVVLFPEFPHEFTKDEDKDHPAKWSKDFKNIYYGFSLDQARYIIQNLQSRQEICNLDEILTLHDKGARIEVDDLNNTIKSSNRAMDLNMNSTTPDPTEIAQVDFYYRVLAWNRKEKTTLVLRCYAEGKSSQATGLNLVNDAILVFSVNEPEALTMFVNEKTLEEKQKIKQRGGHTKAKTADIKAISNDLVGSYHELDDAEDMQYYKSSKAAIKEFAELDEAISARAGRNLDLVVNRAFWKLTKHVEPEKTENLAESVGPALPIPLRETRGLKRRERKDFVVRDNSILDQTILAQEIARCHDSDEKRRVPFLQDGLFVTRDEVKRYLDDQAFSKDDLSRLSREHLAQAREDARAGRIDMSVFKNERELYLDRIEAMNAGQETQTPGSMVETAVPRVIQGMGFQIDIDTLLKRYTAEKQHGDSKQAQVFKRRYDGALPAVIKDEFGLQSTDGVTWIWKHVLGWVSNEIGHDYEPWHAVDFKTRHSDVERYECEGKKGKTFPDNVFYYTSGNIDVYSLKCETMDGTTSKKVGEFQAEIDAANHLASQYPAKIVRCQIHYFDIKRGDSVSRELDHVHPPKSVTIARDKTGRLGITYKI